MRVESKATIPVVTALLVTLVVASLSCGVDRSRESDELSPRAASDLSADPIDRADAGTEPEDAQPTTFTVVPACTPWPGSSVDVCERRVPWPRPELKYPAIVPLFHVPDTPPTLREEMDAAFTSRDDVPHIVARGVVAPGSTRCRVQSGHGKTPADPNKDLVWMTDTSNIRCYSELAVREYLVGSGPERVTLWTGRRFSDNGHWTYGTVPRDAAYFADISEPLVEALEGREWVYWLEVPSDPTTETWDVRRYWSVQKLEDGTIVTVSRWSGHDVNQAANQSRLEMPLASYETQVKAAHGHYVTLYGGKVDARDGAPSLIASADDASLKAYLRAEGVYDVPGFTASPPPPPPLRGPAR